MKIINQFHSIGDILFVEPICRKILNQTGEKPLLPVRDHLMWLANHIDSANFIPLSKSDLDIESMDITYPDYLPLRFANQIINNYKADYHDDYENCMPDKYKLANLLLPFDLLPDDWMGINLQFNEQKGLELFDKLRLSHNEEYVLINEYSQAGKIIVDIEQMPYKVVYMREIPGFTLIDWFSVILNAKEFHTVSTSTFYLLQAIVNKYQLDVGIYIYPRPNKDGLRGIEKLNTTFKFTKVWNID